MSFCAVVDLGQLESDVLPAPLPLPADARRSAGNQPFGPLLLNVRPPTLIPRPETEEWACRLADLLAVDPPATILDLCTGSGCIPLLLLHALPATRAHGVDLSPAALALARENAALQRLGTRFETAERDLFAHGFAARWAEAHGPADLVTSNPPYIPAREMRTLDRAVLDWEDERALLGDVSPSARSLGSVRLWPLVRAWSGVNTHPDVVLPSPAALPCQPRPPLARPRPRLLRPDRLLPARPPGPATDDPAGRRGQRPAPRPRGRARPSGRRQGAPARRAVGDRPRPGRHLARRNGQGARRRRLLNRPRSMPTPLKAVALRSGDLELARTQVQRSQLGDQPSTREPRALARRLASRRTSSGEKSRASAAWADDERWATCKEGSTAPVSDLAKADGGGPGGTRRRDAQTAACGPGDACVVSMWTSLARPARQRRKGRKADAPRAPGAARADRPSPSADLRCPRPTRPRGRP